MPASNNFITSIVRIFNSKVTATLGVFALVSAGFAVGRYYEEVIQLKEITELKNKQTLELIEISNKHQIEILELNRTISTLVVENEKKKSKK